MLKFERTEEQEQALEEMLTGLARSSFPDNWKYFEHLRQRHITISHDKAVARRELRSDRDDYNRARSEFRKVRNGLIDKPDGKNAEIRDAQLSEMLDQEMEKLGSERPDLSLENISILIAINEGEIEDYRDALKRIELEMRMTIADTEQKERIYE